jgi:hypothetical protein
MAGQPKRRAEMVKLDDYGAETALAEIAEGRSVTDITAKLGIRREQFYQWVNRRGLKEQLAQARKLQAEGLVEKVTARLEKATPENIAIEREFAKHVQWLSGKLDRETYGDRPSVAIQLNVGEAFIQAMKEVKA